MNTERLLQLADFLETRVPESKFDMQWWIRDKDDLLRLPDPAELFEECGTSACALGWTAVLFEGWSFEGQAPAFNNSWGWAAAMKFFGLTYMDAETIFGYAPRTPREEAELIRQVVRRVQ